MCPFSGRRAITNDSITLATCALLCAIIAAIAGCGDKSEKPAPAKAASNADTNTPPQVKNAGDMAKAPEPSSTSKTPPEQSAAGDAADGKKSLVSKSINAPPAEVDNSPRKPATVEEAQRVLDLTTFPLPKGAETGGERAIAHVSYRIAGSDAKSAFDFVRQQFTERGWKEIGETSMAGDGASGTFVGQGFIVTVSAYPDSSDKESKTVSVSITNQGNLNLARLPVPPGAKLHHSGATSVMYTTELSSEVATEAVRKLLTEQGWTPYGDNISTKNYKQNAILLSANVITRQAPDNRIMISYLASLMSADLPAPPQALDVTYTDYMSPPKQLLFETAAARDELYQFYRDTLAKEGWEPTIDKPITDQYKAFMIFRNKAKDLMELETENPQQGKIRGTLKHQSAAEVAEIKRQIELDRPRREAELKRKLKEEVDKKAQREQVERDKEAAEKERRRVVVELPGDAKDVKFEPDAIKFTVGNGKAKAAADAIAKQIRNRGWKEGKVPTDPTAGSYKFERDDQSVYIFYLETRSVPSEVRVTGFRVDFEKAAAEKK
jgi:hypothetical protein